ncbi:exonuclease domain-containing protein [Bdellovibrio sp. BCCA]|uniref:exonuclease domain-containing protein n=1 Tax=Bdellovibrio sp. BCCA TaxID=3136281 RepID=UPI0030F22D91
MGRLIWTDLETTGTNKADDQALEFAAAVDDENGDLIETVEGYVKLKDGVTPSPKALEINGINPFSKAYAEASITEAQMVQKYIDLFEKHTVNGVKPRIAGQKVSFDTGFLAVAFARQGKRLGDYVTKTHVELMKISDNAVKAGIITTEKTKGGKSSVAQSAVAKALGFEFEGKGAHRSLPDILMSRKIGHHLYPLLSNGKKITDPSPDIAAFEEGKVYSVTTFSKSSGMKRRNIKVLMNDNEKMMIAAVDDDDIFNKNKGKFKDTAVRRFNYETIIDVHEVSPDEEQRLNAISDANPEMIKDVLSSPDFSSMKNSIESNIFHEDSKNFELIEKVRSRMATAPNKKLEYDQVMAELTKDLKSRVSAKTVLTRAERMHTARGLRGWTRDISTFGNVPFFRDVFPNETVEIACHPSGHYMVKVTGNGTLYREKFTSKAALKGALVKKCLNFEMLEKRIKDLPTPGDFEDPKHPLALEGELRNAIDAVRGNPSKMEAIQSLALLFKQKYPKSFEKINTDKANFFADYYLDANAVDDSYQPSFAGMTQPLEGVQSLSSKETPKLTLIDGGAEAKEEGQSPMQMTIDDHLPPSAAASNVQCAMCNRKLSKEFSKQMGMGPTCITRARYIDNSAVDAAEFVESMVEYNIETAKQMRKGAAMVVKFKVNGEERSVFADSIRHTLDNKVVFVDRRKLQSAIAKGEDFLVAEYMATVQVAQEAVVSFGKVQAKKVEAKMAA